MSRSEDLLLLLTCGLALGACEPAVDDDDPGQDSGDDRELVDAAVDACMPWARQYVACFEEVEGSDESDVYAGYGINYVSMVGYCVATVGYAQELGSGCVTAYEDYYACLGALGCEALLGDVEVEYGDDDGGGSDVDEDPRPCAAEEAALENECDGPSSDSVDVPEEG